MPEIEVLPSPQALADAAVRKFLHLAEGAIASRGRFSVALSGGSTPQRMYALLAGQAYASQVDWRKVHFFWGDERCVPPEHPDSNFRMARLALLDKLPIPKENLHCMSGELEPALAAETYEAELKAFFGPAILPALDLVLLGLGDDGHTASLFPGSPALEEDKRWVVAVEHNVPPPPLVPRLTLTLPVLNTAAQVLFLVSGTAKAERLRQVLIGDQPSHLLPAQLVKPVKGKLIWMVDREAAAYLNP